MASEAYANKVLSLVDLVPTEGSKDPVDAIVQTLSEKAPHLLGERLREEVNQWLCCMLPLFNGEAELSTKLTTINALLLHQTFLVGDSLTAADLALFAALAQQPQAASSFLSEMKNLRRWFTLIQSRVSSATAPALVMQLSPSVVLIPLKSASKTEGNKDADVINKTAMKEVIASPEKLPTNEKNEKKKEAEKKEKKEKKETAPAAPSTPVAADLNPMKLDIRVGVILRCWEHPEAEKLLCEEIDVGEAVPRTIASGLKAHYSAESMVGRQVLVLANLKDRTMVGFKSQGMVLCACNEDHTIVKLVSPPVGSKPGERVTFPGYEGEPASANEVAKKKILEGLAPHLKTDESGVANWKGAAFTVADGVCSSELPSATVS